MSDPARDPSGSPGGSQGRPRRADSPAKTPEQVAEENAFFSRPVCPCEEEEPEAISEYDVPGEWLTYTGQINPAVFAWASRHAENESNRVLGDTEKCNRTQMTPVNGDPHHRELCSESSSSGQNSEAAPSSLLIAAVADPNAPSFEEGAASVADEVARVAEEFPSATLKSPAFKESGGIAIETALAAMRVHEVDIQGGIPTQYLHETAASAPTLDDKEEILDEWEVFETAQDARDAAAKSELAANDARQARRRADAAEAAGTLHAAYLAREAVRFDYYAAQAAQVAINAEAKAVRVAQRFAQANEAALRAKAIAQAQAAEKVEKKE